MSARVDQIRTQQVSNTGWLDRMPEFWFSQLLLAPVYLVMILGLGFPLLYSFYVSFFDLQLTRLNESRFLGIDNYLKLLSDHFFRTSLFATLTFAICATALSVVIAVGLAILLDRSIRARPIFMVILLIPW